MKKVEAREKIAKEISNSLPLNSLGEIQLLADKILNLEGDGWRIAIIFPADAKDSPFRYVFWQAGDNE